MIRALAIAVTLAGCWSGSQPSVGSGSGSSGQGSAVVHPVSPLAVRLTASPRALVMASRGDFRVGFAVTNTSREAVDPGVMESLLLVNGKSSMQWAAVVGNGSRDAEWEALPPGRELAFEWAIGEQLFPAPGDYTLVLQVGSVETPPLAVHVGP